ncbi:Ankyrin repeat domain-containing protein 54 [Durusdinium trenchii]|uniref:Ankyrin repeat domain-containing protein 54 n=1 Tax=Durusdinium trenchii TaxID=1381693 RepID=A0ABP0IAT0_9DINO
MLLQSERLLVRIYTFSTDSADFHANSFSEASALNLEFNAVYQWLQQQIDAKVQEFDLGVGWPLKIGWKRVQRYYDLLWQDVFDSEHTWEAMERRQEQEEISDEFYHKAFAEVADALEDLSLDWWPCRGTLIAFLRHGARSGELSGGIDVVERDIDIMVGVKSESEWYSTGRSLEDALLKKGWDRCWAKSSSSNTSKYQKYQFSMRRDLLYCVRTEPAYIMLDVTSYISTRDYIYVHRVCENHGSALQARISKRRRMQSEKLRCFFPRVGPLQHALDARGAVLEIGAVYPLRKCLANDRAVPCPNRPLNTIQAMTHSALSDKCIALPDKALKAKVTKEEGQALPAQAAWPTPTAVRRLGALGLVLEDVRTLQERSARLDQMGFQSMSPYFSNCTWLEGEMLTTSETL